MSSIKVLFVGTGPVSNYLSPAYQYETINAMVADFKKRGCVDLLDYCMENDTIEDINSYPSVYMDSVPKKYWTYFMEDVPSHHDLDNHRKLIVRQIKKLYPGVQKIIYDSVDMYIVPPEFCDSMKYVKATDKTFSKKFGVKFIYNKHYKMRFQEYIRKYSRSYDIIWFFGCCHPHYLINNKKSYISNFNSMVVPNGYVLYADPTPTGFGLINIDTRLHDLEQIESYANSNSESGSEDYDSKLSKITYLLRNLTNVKTGVYKF